MAKERRLSQAALAAKEIRAILKKEFPGQKFSVNSDNYSMGDSIRVHWIDGPQEKAVNSLIGHYQYGHFDGMTDMYEYSNSIDGIPQTKFLFCERSISPARAKEIAAKYAEKYGHEIEIAESAFFDGRANAEWADDVPENWKCGRYAYSEIAEFEREELSA